MSLVLLPSSALLRDSVSPLRCSVCAAWGRADTKRQALGSAAVLWQTIRSCLKASALVRVSPAGRVCRALRGVLSAHSRKPLHAHKSQRLSALCMSKLHEFDHRCCPYLPRRPCARTCMACSRKQLACRIKPNQLLYPVQNAGDGVLPPPPKLGVLQPRSGWNATSLAFLGDAVWEVRTSVL